MGLLRLGLATMVVLHHLMSFPFIGHHAVLFFFTISGYLMTLVMQNRYGYSAAGSGATGSCGCTRPIWR